MSYTRDKDAHTRGVGAIAAADGGRSRLRRRIAIGKALRARDRVMSRLTYGPNGGVAGLGALNIGGARSQTGMVRDTTIDGGGGGGRLPVTVPGTVYAPQPGGRGGTPTPAPFNIANARFTPAGSRVIAPTSSRTGGKPAGPGLIVDPGPSMYTCPDGSQVSDVAACSVSSTIQTTGTTSGGTTSGGSSGGSSSGGAGGGGGGGAGVTTGGGTAPDLTAPSVPDDVPEGAAPGLLTQMTTTEKVVLAAAAVGGLYLIFKNKGK